MYYQLWYGEYTFGYNAIKSLGYDPLVSNRGDDVDKSDIFILPGVGVLRLP